MAELSGEIKGIRDELHRIIAGGSITQLDLWFRRHDERVKALALIEVADILDEDNEGLRRVVRVASRTSPSTTSSQLRERAEGILHGHPVHMPSTRSRLARSE